MWRRRPSSTLTIRPRSTWPTTRSTIRRHFFIREKVEEHELVVPFVKTTDNYADFFTKALDPAPFFAIRNKIMNIDSSSTSSSDESLTALIATKFGHA